MDRATFINPFGGPRISDPHDLFRAGQSGAWWNFSSTSLLYTTATTGGAAPTNGQTIALAAGSRVANLLTTGLDAELVQNGSFDSDTTGWTPIGATLSVVGGRMRVTSGVANTAASDTLATIAGAFLYGRADVYANSGSGCYFLLRSSPDSPLATTTIPVNTSATPISFLAVTPVANPAVKCQIIGASQYADYDNISVKPINGRPALQATTSLKPIWRSASAGYADFDGTDDVLSATFPAQFTGDVLYLTPAGAVVELLGQTITTTYNLPAVDMKHCIIRSTMTAAERNALKAWMLRQPLA